MDSPLSFLMGSRRDPWWDVEGSSLRRERRIRRVVELVMLGLAVVVVGLASSLVPQAGRIGQDELVALLVAAWLLALAATFLRARSRISVR